MNLSLEDLRTSVSFSSVPSNSKSHRNSLRRKRATSAVVPPKQTTSPKNQSANSTPAGQTRVENNGSSVHLGTSFSYAKGKASASLMTEGCLYVGQLVDGKRHGMLFFDTNNR